VPPLEESGGARMLRVVAGEGMLIATVDGTYRDAYGTHQIKAGITRVAPDHPLARLRPEAFRVAWKEDVIVMRKHRDNLRARMEELRGERDKPSMVHRAKPWGLGPWAWEKPYWYIG
jgi:hypothetical protein